MDESQSRHSIYVPSVFTLSSFSFLFLSSVFFLFFFFFRPGEDVRRVKDGRDIL